VSLDLLDVKEWPESERLSFEKEVLGLYISGHPLARYEKEILSYSSCSFPLSPTG
jgi:DNA polymerase-3 subunit alpha